VIDLAGGVAVAVPGEPTDGWRADVAHLDVRRTPRTAAVLLTSPVNPTGAVLGRPRVREIARWAADHDVRLVVDDAYWAYAGCDDVVADAGPRAVLVGGVSKVHALAGLRLGWVCSPPDLSGAVDDVVEHVTGPTSTPSQAAGLAALTEPFCAADVAARARRQAQALAAATALMGTIAAVDVVPAQAGMYLCLSVQRPLRARALGAVDDRALCAAIEHRVGVRLRAGSTFGLPGHVRLSTAAPWTELEEATARLRDLSIATRRDDHLTTSAFSSGEQYR
jgi:aspartate aminotransferase